jgi:hypothetical protein
MSATNRAVLDDEGVQLTDIVSPELLVEENPDLFPKGKGSLDWAIRNRDRNGLSEAGAVILANGKLMLVRPRYLRWLLTHRA